MQELPQSSFAEKLRDAGMSEFEIGWVCSKLVEEQFDLNETKYVGRDMGKTELKTIENYLLLPLESQILGINICLMQLLGIV